jgi:hypothetical protein
MNYLAGHITITVNHQTHLNRAWNIAKDIVTQGSSIYFQVSNMVWPSPIHCLESRKAGGLSSMLTSSSWISLRLGTVLELSLAVLWRSQEMMVWRVL